MAFLSTISLLVIMTIIVLLGLSAASRRNEEKSGETLSQQQSTLQPQTDGRFLRKYLGATAWIISLLAIGAVALGVWYWSQEAETTTEIVQKTLPWIKKVPPEVGIAIGMLLIAFVLYLRKNRQKILPGLIITSVCLLLFYLVNSSGLLSKLLGNFKEASNYEKEAWIVLILAVIIAGISTLTNYIKSEWPGFIAWVLIALYAWNGGPTGFAEVIKDRADERRSQSEVRKQSKALREKTPQRETLVDYTITKKSGDILVYEFELEELQRSRDIDIVNRCLKIDIQPKAPMNVVYSRFNCGSEKSDRSWNKPPAGGASCVFFKAPKGPDLTVRATTRPKKSPDDNCQ